LLETGDLFDGQGLTADGNERSPCGIVLLAPGGAAVRGIPQGEPRAREKHPSSPCGIVLLAPGGVAVPGIPQGKTVQADHGVIAMRSRKLHGCWHWRLLRRTSPCLEGCRAIPA